jgi:tetratricopeptide (TPR) repeat protein
MKPIFLALALSALVSGCAHQAAQFTTPKLDNLNKQILANPENAQAYSNRGYTLAMLGQKQAARADLRRAVTLKNTGPMHNGAGWAYFNLGDYDTALREWQTAAELSQYKAHYDYYSLALGYWGVGNTQKALENFALAVEREPKFGNSKTLDERTAEWTPKERLVIKQMYALWTRTWRQ